MSAVPLRASSDDRSAGVLTGRFRRRVSAPCDAEGHRLVSRAIRRAREGDNDALRFLYIRYADSVYGYVRGIVQDEHDAEDVTQQVFTKLMTVLPKYRERDVPFAAWILRVARNAALDRMRQRRTVSTEEARETEARFDEVAYDRALILQEALRSLPAEQREVLVLRHVIGMSPGEIARSLGKSEASIHGLHHRGRGALKRVLLQSDAAPTTVARVASLGIGGGGSTI